MANDPATKVSPNFLISAAAYLKAQGGFELIGREDDMAGMTNVLLRQGKNNNLLLTGPSGVGLSSLIMGLQSTKTDPSTPLGMLEKNFFYLDTDALFSSSDSKAVDEGFDKAMNTLSTMTGQGKGAVLIIEDTKTFMNGVTDTRSSNMVNKLMRALQTNPNLQVIFAATKEERAALYKSHAGFEKLFTVEEVEEPSEADLRAIVEAAARKMEEQYGVTISQKAIDKILELTKRFQLSDLPAEPTRSLLVLEGTITSNLITARTKPPGLDELTATLENVSRALESGEPAKGDLADKKPDELEAIRIETQESITELEKTWGDKQKEVADLYKKIADEEDFVQYCTMEIERLIESEKAARAFKQETAKQVLAARKELADAEARGDKDAVTQTENAIKSIKQRYGMKTGEEFIEQTAEQVSAAQAASDGLMDDLSGFSSGEIKEFDVKREEAAKTLKADKERCKELLKKAEGDSSEITEDDVLSHFGRISKIPMNKLKEDEKEKLLHLAEKIKERVFGQDEPIDALADAVLVAKQGLKKPNEPIANFLFLGPSGVGKTETAKALAEALFGDESALVEFRMENYQDKTSINTLLGSPQGLVGYEEGGKLVNTVLAKPYSVLLFDELEKGHEDVFNTFLAMTDEGVVEDTRGIKAYFGNVVNIFTSNYGWQYFLDPALSQEEAFAAALDDLRKDPKFHPAFLNRLTIFAYNALGEVEIIRIAEKNLKELNEQAAARGVSIDMPKSEIEEMCRQQYDPYEGGRGIRKYFKKKLNPSVARTTAENDEIPGVVHVEYAAGEVDTAAIEQLEKDKAELKEKITRIEFAEERREIMASTEEPAEGETPEDKERFEKALEKVEEKIKSVKDAGREKATLTTNFIPGAPEKPEAAAEADKPAKEKKAAAPAP